MNEAIARLEEIDRDRARLAAVEDQHRAAADRARGTGACHQCRPRGPCADGLRGHSTRADLEALVETSPVGVVVLNARAGRAVSFNCEARRIVESLRTAGHPAERLREVVPVRRVDGREVSLAEIPLEQTLGTGETVHAEEIVLSVPDDRSGQDAHQRHADPHRGGEIGSVVVTT